MSSYEFWYPEQIVSSERYPFTEGQLRHLLHKRHKNGLEKAVRRIGKRLLLRIDLFDEWIDCQGKKR